MLDATTSASAAAAAATPAASAFSGLDSDAFMQLLIAQMRYQDPLAPSDPTAMLQQTSMLAQTEMIQQVAQVQQQLLGLQQAEMASDLVGAQITAELADGTRVEGTVEAVRFTADGPTLLVGETEVPLSAASEVRPG